MPTEARAALLAELGVETIAGPWRGVPRRVVLDLDERLPAPCLENARARLPTIQRRGPIYVAAWRGGAVALTDAPEVCVRAPAVAAPELLARTMPLLRIAIAHALALEGLVVLHAAAFAVGGEHVVVLGETGAGKSTVAMAALRAGGRVLSDDCIVAGPGAGGEPIVAPFRRDVLLRTAGEAVLDAHTAARVQPVHIDGIPRGLLRRSDAPERFTPMAGVSQVWAVSVDRRLRASRAERLTGGEALARLIDATSPVYLSARFPRQRGRILNALAALASAGPALRVRLGTDLLADPRGVVARLVDLGGPGRHGHGNRQSGSLSLVGSSASDGAAAEALGFTGQDER